MNAHVEQLESRRLLSSWSTVDNLPSSDNGVLDMTSDPLGNVYAVGDTVNASGQEAYVLREKPSGSTGWITRASFGAGMVVRTIAADPHGNVFAGGDVFAGGGWTQWTVWEVAGGSNTPVVIDSSSAGVPRDLAVDPAGNVYAVGDQPMRRGYEWTVRKGSFSVSTGRWAFATVDQVAAASNAWSVGVVTATINGAPSTSVYVVGNVPASTSTWTVRRSTDGGPWATVDSYHYDSAGGSSTANAVTGDASGNVFVAGIAQKGTLTGYDKHHNPIYTYSTHWIVRKSTGGSWAVDDDYVAQYGANYNAVCADPSGHVYVAGEVFDANGNDHAVVRTNAGGAWATADDFTGSGSAGQGWYFGITADPSGNVYAGGGEIDGTAANFSQRWLIRSRPAAATNLTASPDAALSSSQIDLSWANPAGSDQTGFAIYRSTDGINFALIGTTAAGVTSYDDSGLSAGTLYDYYVITLLNGDGSSGPSNTAGGTTGA